MNDIPKLPTILGILGVELPPNPGVRARGL
jgi:hypothetical protein